MFKKTNQSGRSMVEMIAVLAIMGILSIGGLSGINYIKNKNVANKIQKEVLTQASELKTRHRLGADIDPDNGGEVPYHYGSEFVASRFYTPGTKTLAIRADASRKVCEMLQLNPPDIFACISTTSVTSCGNITTDCAEQNTMTFVIDDMSLLPGGGEPVDPCKDVTCPNDNYTCAAGVCICKTGYFGEDCSGECPTPEEGCHKETMTDSNGCTTFRKTSCTQEGQVCNMTDGSCYCGKGECSNIAKCLTNETMYDENGNKIENPTSESTGNCCSSTQEWVPGAGINGEGRCKDFCPTENGAGRDATTHECLCATGYQLSADGKTCERACEFGYCLNLTSSPCMDSSKYVMFDENGNEIEEPDVSSSGYCCNAGQVLIDGHCCPSTEFEWVESAKMCLRKCPTAEEHGAGRDPTTHECTCETVSETERYEFDGSRCVLTCTMDCYNLNTTTRTCERHYNTEYCCSNHTDGKSTNLWDNNSQKCSVCTKSQEICRSGSKTWCCPPGQCGNQVEVCCSGTLCCPKNQQPFCANGSYSSGCLEERCCTGNLDLADPENGVYLCCASGSTPYCSSYTQKNGEYVCTATACCAGGVRKKTDGRDVCCGSSGSQPYCPYYYFNKTTGQCSDYSCCSSGYKVLTMQEGFEYCSSSSYTPYCSSYNSDGSCYSYSDCYTPSSDPNRIKQINGMDVCCGSSSQTPFCKNSSCSSRGCCSGKVISTSGGSKVCCSGTSGSSYCSSYSSSDPSKCSGYACCSGSSVVKKLGNLETCCSSSATPYCEYYNSNGECYDVGCCSGGKTYCDSYKENTSTGALTCSRYSCCSSSNTLTTHKGIDACHGSLWKPRCQYSTKDGSKCKTVDEYCSNSSTITSFGVVEACCSSTQKPYCSSYNSNGTCYYASCCSTTLVKGSDGRYTCQTTSSDKQYTDYAGNTKTCKSYYYVRPITGLSGKSVCCTSSSDTVGYCSQYDTSGTCTAAACCSNDKMVACYEYSLSGKCLKKGCCVGGNIYCNAVDESGQCVEEACCVGTTYCADGSTDCTAKKCCKSGKTIKCTNEDETTGNCIENSCS